MQGILKHELSLDNFKKTKKYKRNTNDSTQNSMSREALYAAFQYNHRTDHQQNLMQNKRSHQNLRNHQIMDK